MFCVEYWWEMWIVFGSSSYLMELFKTCYRIKFWFMGRQGLAEKKSTSQKYLLAAGMHIDVCFSIVFWKWFIKNIFRYYFIYKKNGFPSLLITIWSDFFFFEGGLENLPMWKMNGKFKHPVITKMPQWQLNNVMTEYKEK